MTEHLFVYGTLRSGFPHPLSRRLQTKARLIGKASALGVLYDFGWYPGAIFDAAARSRVIGEVFLLKNAERLLAELDHYEGTAEPSNPFRRVSIEVLFERGGTIDAWSYAMVDPPQRRRAIPSGDYVLHLKTVSPRPRRP